MLDYSLACLTGVLSDVRLNIPMRKPHAWSESNADLCLLCESILGLRSRILERHRDDYQKPARVEGPRD